MAAPTVWQAEPFPVALPQTPPHTPNAIRQRFYRADSPASIHSIHPLETISPTKQKEQSTPQDGIKVEELHEGDVGYTTETELIYPNELEEPRSPNRSDAEELSSSSSSSSSENEITYHFSRLGCTDEQEARFERQRRARRRRHRVNSRVFKRTHSQSAQGDEYMSEMDTMADQGNGSSARRLRRRVRGPSEVQVVSDERTPPPSRECAEGGSWKLGQTSSKESETQKHAAEGGDIMEIDAISG